MPVVNGIRQVDKDLYLLGPLLINLSLQAKLKKSKQCKS